MDLLYPKMRHYWKLQAIGIRFDAEEDVDLFGFLTGFGDSADSSLMKASETRNRLLPLGVLTGSILNTSGMAG